MNAKFALLLVVLCLAPAVNGALAGSSGVESQLGASSNSYRDRVVPTGNDIQSKLVQGSSNGDFGNEQGVSKAFKAGHAKRATTKVKEAGSARSAEVVDYADNLTSDSVPLVKTAECVTDWTDKGSQYVCK